MKKFLILAAWSVAAVACPVTVHSAAPKSPATPAPASVSTETTAAKPKRPLPFQGVVSKVSPTAKTFTITTKAGKDHLFTITDKTQILKNDAPAKLEDIKPDEIVRGSRLKMGENQWEAVKVIIGAKAKAN